MDANRENNDEFDRGLDSCILSDGKIAAFDEKEEIKIPNIYCVIKFTKAIMQAVTLQVGKYKLTFRRRGLLSGKATIPQQNNPGPSTSQYWFGNLNESHNIT